MSTVTQKVEIEETFNLAENVKMSPFDNQSITLVKSTANAVQYARRNIRGNGATSFTADFQLGEQNFIDRGIYCEFQVPIKLTLQTPAASAPNATTYLTWANNFENLALRQWGILNGIDTLNIQFNNATVSSVVDVAKKFETISEYYSDTDVNEIMQASQPDRFSDYNQYNDGYNTNVQTLSETSKAILYKPSKIAQENIFTGGYTNEYNSRKPYLQFLGNATTDSCDFLATFYTFLPFTQFGLVGNDLSLYGITTLSVNVNFFTDFVKRIFVTNQATIGSLERWKSIEFAHSSVSEHVANFYVKQYTPPAAIANIMRDATGMIKPYRVGFTEVALPPVKPIPATALQSGVEFQFDNINAGQLPKALYISVHARRDGSPTPYRIPNFKARIRDLKIDIDTETTVMGTSVVNLFMLAKSNGLNKDYESALFTNGYVLKIDISKDIGANGRIIGSNGNVNINISGQFDNLANFDVNYELRCVVAYESQLIFVDRNFSTSKTIIFGNTPIDYDNLVRSMYANNRRNLTMIGGGFFGDLWNNVKKAAGNAWKYVKDNPEEVLKKALQLGKLAMGGSTNIPVINNISGGSQTRMLGAGETKTYSFK